MFFFLCVLLVFMKWMLAIEYWGKHIWIQQNTCKFQFHFAQNFQCMFLKMRREKKKYAQFSLGRQASSEIKKAVCCWTVSCSWQPRGEMPRFTYMITSNGIRWPSKHCLLPLRYTYFLKTKLGFQPNELRSCIFNNLYQTDVLWKRLQKQLSKTFLVHQIH